MCVCVCVWLVSCGFFFFADFVVVTLLFLRNVFNASLVRVPMKSYPVLSKSHPRQDPIVM